MLITRRFIALSLTFEPPPNIHMLTFQDAVEHVAPRLEIFQTCDPVREGYS